MTPLFPVRLSNPANGSITNPPNMDFLNLIAPPSSLFGCLRQPVDRFSLIRSTVSAHLPWYVYTTGAWTPIRGLLRIPGKIPEAQLFVSFYSTSACQKLDRARNSLPPYLSLKTFRFNGFFTVGSAPLNMHF